MPFDSIQLAKIIWVAIGLFLLIAAFQWILLPTLVDGFRQRVFNLRREMFLLVANGKISPEEPAYTHLRSTMNGVIRFAKHLTFLRLLLHGTLFRKYTLAYSQRLKADLASISNSALRQQLIQFRLRLGQEIIRHVLFISPIAWVFALVISPLLLGILMFQGVHALAKLGQKSVAALAEHLYVQGIEAQAEALVIRD